MHYYFIAENGEKIEDNKKCHNNCDKYTHSKVIYNPQNPLEYDFLFDYNDYSPIFSFIFSFCLYLPVMVFILFQLVKIIAIFYLKSRKNTH